MDDNWGISDSSQFDLRVWDDEAVLFVEATADTHHLSSTATVVCVAMRAEAGTLRPAHAWYRSVLGDVHVVAGDADEAPMELPEFETLLLGLERIGVAVRRSA